MTLLRKGDQVFVRAGADKGQTGRILQVNRKKNQVVVEGVNMKFKHVRRTQENPQGGRIQREYPVHISNVSFLDTASGKGVRLGTTMDGGKKVRVMRPSGKKVES